MEIYTVSALAQKKGVHPDYLRHLLAKAKDGRAQWHEWKFYRIGSGKRGVWFACNGDEEITIYD